MVNTMKSKKKLGKILGKLESIVPFPVSMGEKDENVITIILIIITRLIVVTP